METMTHPDEGTLLADLDGELVGAEAKALREHLEGCRRCAERLERLQASRDDACRALAALDVPAPVDAAREELRGRVAARPRAGRGVARPRRGRVGRGALARAAILVLLVAGVAADQLPGSPVRGWLGDVLDGVRSALVGGPEEAPVVRDAATGPVESGVRVAAAAGRVRIILTDLPPGSRIDVRLVDGSEAEVRGMGSGRYRAAPGVIEVVGPGSRVQVEIPRDVSAATVEVDGRVYLRKEGARLEVAGPATDSTEAELRFRTPGGDGPPGLD